MAEKDEDASPFVRIGGFEEERSPLCPQKFRGQSFVKEFYDRRPILTYIIIGAAVVLFLILVITIAAVISNAASVSQNSVCANPPLLIISLDGFRNDYIDRGITPNIASLGSSGVRAQYMMPVFPSLTFPSHYSIVTGLYPESHGIVSNFFYDRTFRQSFNMKSTDSKWWLGEPIWVTAKKNNLSTAVYFWPGSEVEIGGIRPDTFFKYNGSVPYMERVNTVLSWIDRPADTRPQFMAVYFNQPDHAGHAYGPNSTGVNDTLRGVDGVIGAFISGLKDRGVFDCVNMLLVTDHGMATVFKSKTFALKQTLLPADLYDQYNSTLTYGVFSNLYLPVPQNDTLLNLTYSTLKQNVRQLSAPFNVYLMDDAPPQYHIGEFNKQRFGDILIIAQTGSFLKKMTSSSYTNKGTHGYNNTDSLMRSIFFAHGPAFKTGYLAAPFENIQIYNLMCSLLKITPSANNGTEGALNSMLR